MLIARTDSLAVAMSDRREAHLCNTLPIVDQRKKSVFGAVGMIGEKLMYPRQHGNNRRARSANVDYLIEQRKDTRDCLNRAAQMTGCDRRLDIERDADYLSYLSIQQNRGSWARFATVLRLTLSESWALGQDAKDTLERLIRRCTCAVAPKQGMLMMSVGPRRYLRQMFMGVADNPSNPSAQHMRSEEQQQ